MDSVAIAAEALLRIPWNRLDARNALNESVGYLSHRFGYTIELEYCLQRPRIRTERPLRELNT